MLLAAPGLFSMTTGWPSRSESHGAMMRETMSAPPPGGKPTTQRSGRDGQVCACARPETAGSASVAPASERNLRRGNGMVFSLHLGAGEFHHLAPLVDLAGEGLGEIGRGAGRGIAAELDNAGLDALFAEAGVHLLVEA